MGGFAICARSPELKESVTCLRMKYEKYVSLCSIETGLSIFGINIAKNTKVNTTLNKTPVRTFLFVVSVNDINTYSQLKFSQ